MALPFNASSTTQDILTLFETLIDDQLDQNTELELAEAAKNEVEDERVWAMLKKVDTSQSVSGQINYLTTFPLPADFREPMDSGIFVGTGTELPYLQLPFEDLYLIQDNIAYRYIIDIANSVYHLLGVPQANPIFFYYKKTTPTLALNVNPVWPYRFWPLIAYKMAMNFYAIDQGQKAIAWDDRWKDYYDSLHQQMVSWDTKNQMMAYQNRQQRQQTGPLVLDYNR